MITDRTINAFHFPEEKSETALWSLWIDELNPCNSEVLLCLNDSPIAFTGDFDYDKTNKQPVLQWYLKTQPSVTTDAIRNLESSDFGDNYKFLMWYHQNQTLGANE